MEKGLIYCLMALVFASACFAMEKEHEMCCNSCVSTYGTSSNLELACLRGCRLYGMLFLAHDRSVERSEIAGLCAKSCSAGGDGDACAAGCARQERVFRERRVGSHAARLAVAYGLPAPPLVDSPAPYHAHMFNRLPGGGASAWLHAVRIRVRPLPAGPDGQPRYWVEVSEQAIPLRLATADELPDAAAAGSVRRGGAEVAEAGQLTFATRLSHRARVGIRWAACSLLAMSLMGLLWLGCGMLSSAPRVRVMRLVGVLRKQPLPSVQSGDIFSADDKKPLLVGTV